VKSTFPLARIFHTLTWHTAHAQNAVEGEEKNVDGGSTHPLRMQNVLLIWACLFFVNWRREIKGIYFSNLAALSSLF
jgi:hypothetical protein